MNVLFVLLISGFWIGLVVYFLWYVFKAKTVEPLTLDDLALTWKVHKRQKGCNASRIQSLIKENDEIVGFRCACGYEFIQRRLITQTPHEQVFLTSKHVKQRLSNVSKKRQQETVAFN